MLTSDIKLSIKNYIPKKIKFFLSNFLRIVDVFLMMIALNLWPQQTYRFSSRKFLPPKENRLLKSLKMNIPYKLLKEKTDSIDEMDEVYAIGIGASFDLNEIKKFNKPIFLLSFWNSLKIDKQNNIIYSSKTGGYGHNKDITEYENLDDYKNDNLTYVINDPGLIQSFKAKGHNVIAVNTFIEENKTYFPHAKLWEEKNYLDLFDKKKCKRISIIENIVKQPVSHPYPKWSQTGSVLPFLCGLSFFTRKIQVFGWDFFLNSDPNKMSYMELLFNMYNNQADINRSKTHFEEALLNFYYAYKFSKLPNFEIHGNLGKLSKHEKLIKKIEKVFFI